MDLESTMILVGVENELENALERMLTRSPRYLIDKGMRHIYNNAKSISKSGAIQARDLQKTALMIYGIDASVDAMKDFGDIYTKPANMSAAEKIEIGEKYTYARPSLKALFKTARQLKMMDSTATLFTIGNLAIVKRIVSDINNSIREMVIELKYNSNDILSDDELLGKIGLGLWKEDFLVMKINSITRETETLWAKNTKMAESKDTEYDEWEEDYMHGGGAHFGHGPWY